MTTPAGHAGPRPTVFEIAAGVRPHGHRTLGRPRPGHFDPRVILQTQVWVDDDGHTHELDDLSANSCAELLGHLQQRAGDMIRDALATNHRTLDRHYTARRTASPQRQALLDLADTELLRQELVLRSLQPTWIRHTPLARHLEHAADPFGGFKPPPEEPATAHDYDSGSLRVATVTSDYFIDLDSRLMLRSPRRHALDHPDGPLLAFSFESDGYLMPLGELVLCHVGLPLIAVAHPGRYGPQGRIRSTPITAIQWIS